MCSQHCGPAGADPFREGGEWRGCRGTACRLYLLSSESLCTRIALTLDHCGCRATCQNRLMRVDARGSNCACLCAIIKCASGRQLQDNVPQRTCVHLCVHTCICMALPVYTTVLAQGLARWHCARFKCVLISASFLLLKLMPVFCWSVYPALSRLSHKTCFLSVTFIHKCQHEIKVQPVYFHVCTLQFFFFSLVHNVLLVIGQFKRFCFHIIVWHWIFNCACPFDLFCHHLMLS